MELQAGTGGKQDLREGRCFEMIGEMRPTEQIENLLDNLRYDNTLLVVRKCAL